jgi:hypothetical protein
MKYLSLAAGATGTISFGQAVGYFYVRNIGPDSAWMAIGATPPTPSAGDGRIEVTKDVPVDMASVSLMQLSFACAALESAEIEAIGYPILANS